MIPWWRRLIYALMSVLISGFVIGEAANIASADMRQGPLVLIFPPLMVAFVALSGWVVAAPLVLLIGRYKRQRLWLYFALGSGIGPLLILGTETFHVLTDPRHGRFLQGDWKILAIATCVSILTSFIYLLLVTRAQRRVPSAAASPAVEGMRR